METTHQVSAIGTSKKGLTIHLSVKKLAILGYVGVKLGIIYLFIYLGY